MISKNKTPEAMEKGILRAKNDVSSSGRHDPVRHDGRAAHSLPPQEIGLTVDKARELGYHLDQDGAELTSDEQVCELRVQDYVPSISCG